MLGSANARVYEYEINPHCNQFLVWDCTVDEWRPRNDFINTNHIQWNGGANQNLYYETDGVGDELFGFFSVPVRIADGRVLLDSLFLCIWTQGNEDFAHIYFENENCVGDVVVDASAMDVGSGSSGWIDTQILDSATVIIKDRCYRFYLDCTNNGAADIRTRYCTRLYYHTIGD